MNVYVRESARELGRMGVKVDVFTRSQDPAIRRIVPLGENARVIHLPAGPQRPMPREVVHQHLPEFVAGIDEFRETEDLSYDLIHAHYWLSGWPRWSCASAGTRRWSRCSTPWAGSRTAWPGRPTSWSRSSGSPEETRIVRDVDRIVAANVVEPRAPRLVLRSGRRADRGDSLRGGH